MSAARRQRVNCHRAIRWLRFGLDTFREWRRDEWGNSASGCAMNCWCRLEQWETRKITHRRMHVFPSTVAVQPVAEHSTHCVHATLEIIIGRQMLYVAVEPHFNCLFKFGFHSIESRMNSIPFEISNLITWPAFTSTWWKSKTSKLSMFATFAIESWYTLCSVRSKLSSYFLCTSWMTHSTSPLRWYICFSVLLCFLVFFRHPQRVQCISFTSELLGCMIMCRHICRIFSIFHFVRSKSGFIDWTAATNTVEARKGSFLSRCWFCSFFHSLVVVCSFCVLHRPAPQFSSCTCWCVYIARWLRLALILLHTLCAQSVNAFFCYCLPNAHCAASALLQRHNFHSTTNSLNKFTFALSLFLISLDFWSISPLSWPYVDALSGKCFLLPSRFTY